MTTFLGVGGVGSLQLRHCAPSLSPASIADCGLRSLHGRPGCSGSGSIDLPTSCPSLSPPFADDEAYAYHHGDASSTSPSASLRPKTHLMSPRSPRDRRDQQTKTKRGNSKLRIPDTRDLVLLSRNSNPSTSLWSNLISSGQISFEC